jgi:hypothetical protein
MITAFIEWFFDDLMRYLEFLDIDISLMND